MANFIRIAKEIGKSPLASDVIYMAKTFIHTDDTPIAQSITAAHHLAGIPISKVHQYAIDSIANHPVQRASQLGNQLFDSSDSVLNFIKNTNMSKDLAPLTRKNASKANSSVKGMIHLLHELGLGW